MTITRPFPAFRGDGAYIVVCYAHDDAEVVYEEIAWLRDQGVNIWYDEGIRPGREFPSELANAIDGASALLFYGSPRSVASRHCRDEIFYALDHGKPLIACHLEEIVLPAGLALQMGSIQALLRYEMGTPDYETKLLAAIGESLGAAPREPSGPTARRTPRFKRLRRPALAAGIVAAGIVVGMALLSPRDRPSELAAPAPLLAVLPLSTANAAPEQSWLADGLTAVLIGQLDRNDQLRVISPTSVMRYVAAGMPASMPPMQPAALPMQPAGMATQPPPGTAMKRDPMPGMGMPNTGPMTPKPAMRAPMNAMASAKTLDTIVRELKADYVVQGNLTVNGNDIEVGVSILDAKLTEVWNSGRLVRDRSELVMLESDLANGIVKAVLPMSSPSKDVAAARHTPDPAAHQAYLRGIYYQTHWRLPEAIESFQKAIQLDPQYANPYAHLARAYYFLAFFGDVAPGIALGEMQRAAAMALENDPLLAEGHAQMALVRMLLEWNWQAAEHGFIRALELSPNNAQIRHDFAHLLLAMGLEDASLEQTRVAISLDPANPMLTSCLGWHSLFDRKFDQAIEYAAEANRMMPDFWAHVISGWAHLGRNELEPAVADFREGARLSKGGFATAALAHGLAVTGHTEESQRLLAELLASGDDRYVSPYDIASVYAGLGDLDEAFKWLRRAADERSTFIVHLGWDPRFSFLRDDPRYRLLVADRLHLPEAGQGLSRSSSTPQSEQSFRTHKARSDRSL